MQSLNEYQQYLLFGKLTGSLKEQEEQDFLSMMEESEAFRESFEELKSRFPEQDITDSFARLKQPGKWKDIASDIKKKQARKAAGRMRLLSAAAVIAAIAFGGWWLLGTRPVKQPIVIASVKPNQSKGILLRLNDGKLIDLSKTKGVIPTSSGTLNNENETLTYTDNNAKDLGVNKLFVPVGMDYKMVLADGTKLWLNAATEVEFPFNFTGPNREITINGEAFLEVASDAKRPFILHLPRSSVQVLGTEFNVNSYDKKNVSVSLVSGSVKMKAAEKEIVIAKGMEAVLDGSGDIRQQSFDMRHTLSWREGLFYFKQANLEEISGVLPRWYGINVVIDNSKILSRKFTGVVDKNQPIEIFMSDMKRISGIDAYLDKDKVLHFK